MEDRARARAPNRLSSLTPSSYVRAASLRRAALHRRLEGGRHDATPPRPDFWHRIPARSVCRVVAFDEVECIARD